jgi:hypothetical protein
MWYLLTIRGKSMIYKINHKKVCKGNLICKRCGRPTCRRCIISNSDALNINFSPEKIGLCCVCAEWAGHENFIFHSPSFKNIIKIAIENKE